MATPGRKKGCIKTGGRKAGTPNKPKPLKEALSQHSAAYFAPDPDDPQGRSRYQQDIDALDPEARIDAEIKILRYHTPVMQAASVDLTVTATQIDQQLKQLFDDNETN